MRVEPMSRIEQRLEMLESVERFGLTVSEACRLYGVSRETFYYWRRRFEEEGSEGLENRSTAPLGSPLRMPRRLEERIVGMRKQHRRWGARRIRAELKRAGVDILPAVSTIHRVLQRNSLIDHDPAPKPPTASSFRRERGNELWQIDAKDWRLEDGTGVHIISCIDDCSRFCPHLEAFDELTSQAAVTVFEEAAGVLGLPEAVLTDRGSSFTGRTTQTVSEFERHLWTQGVYTINGRPYHPQTRGKVERFHRTLSEWLQDHGPYPSLQALNRSLVEFARHYNHERPHQSLDDATPAEVWDNAEKTGPDPLLAEQRCRRKTIRPTGSTGNITYGSWVIGLGRRWARTKVEVQDRGHTIEIQAADGELIRKVQPDPTRRYLGKQSEDTSS